MIIHHFEQNKNSGITEAGFKWKIGNAFAHNIQTSLSQKVMYTKYLDTLKKVQEEFLDTMQILNIILQIQPPDLEGFIYDCKIIQHLREQITVHIAVLKLFPRILGQMKLWSSLAHHLSCFIYIYHPMSIRQIQLLGLTDAWRLIIYFQRKFFFLFVCSGITDLT